MTAAGLAARVRARESPAVEIAQAFLRRIERIDRHIAAYCAVDPEVTLEMARKVDRQMAAGAPLGPLAGVPVAIKDLIFTKDFPTVSGSALYKGFVPEE